MRTTTIYVHLTDDDLSVLVEPATPPTRGVVDPKQRMAAG